MSMNVSINLSLKKGEETILNQQLAGQFSNNLLTFALDDMQHQLDFAKQTFSRENAEYSFSLNVLEKNCYINLKKEQYKLEIGVDEATFNVFEKSCQIIYLIETDDEKINFNLSWEEQND